MKTLDKVYVPMENIITRNYENEVLILPISNNVANLQEELFSLNDTARDIWLKLDKKITVQHIVEELAKEYNVPAESVQSDVLGFLSELKKRNLIQELA